MGRVAGYRNFCNKLWNAARFVLAQVEQSCDASSAAADSEFSVADRWIRSSFGRMLGQVETAFRDYRFDYAATALYEFTWYEFCDWYIEFTKPVLQADTATAAAKQGTRRTLVEILEALQRALHPLMPFITEEIWQRAAPLAGRSGPTVMLEAYPTAGNYVPDEQAEREIAWIRAVILAVRQIRGEMNIPLSKRIPALFKGASPNDRSYALHSRAYLERLAGLESITILDEGAQVPQSATALVGDMSVLVPLAGLIDAAAEADRLSKLIAKAQQDLSKMSAKLSNESFVRNAPEEVVAKDRERVAELERAVAGMTAQLERIRGLLNP